MSSAPGAWATECTAYQAVNMTLMRVCPMLVAAAIALLAGCATRPINPPITQVDPATGYRYESRQGQVKDKDNLVILAFSGGGTRAAAFSYGVLEFLRKTEVVGPKGNKIRLLDEVDIITGVSGGSFTALAYGLYGDKLFADYEQRFLKRNVQGEIISAHLQSGELDETWVDSLGALRIGRQSVRRDSVQRRHVWRSRPRQWPDDPGVGHRHFDRLPLRLHAARIRYHLFGPRCRAIVPRGCSFVSRARGSFARHDQQLRRYLQQDHACLGEAVHRHRQSAATGRASDTLLKAEEAFGDGANRPFLHLVDGGVSDNVGMRSVLDAMEVLEALHDAGVPTQLDSVKRIIVFVVNSLSSPPTPWDKSEDPPGTVDVLLKSAGTPIDAFSYEAVELLRDTAAQWQTMGLIRDSKAMAANKDTAVAAAIRAPHAEVYAIDVSFAALKNKAEFDYLNQQPTSFVLPPEAVDRLRAAAGTIILDSPEFKRLLKDVGATMVSAPAAPAAH